MDSFQGTPREESPKEFARRLGFTFKDNRLLARALTHRSYINEHPDALEDNERLEFLGDAVLDFLVGAWLYNRFPDLQEGDLTRLRAALVGNQQLAEFARQIDLGAALRLGRGEVDGGGRDRFALIGSAFEALIGALYLDRGIPAVQAFVHPLLKSSVAELIADERIHDPKSQLQEWAQSHGYGAPIYQMSDSSGPDHEKLFMINVIVNGEVVGSGNGNSKRVAAKAAAKDAITRLGIESSF